MLRGYCQFLLIIFLIAPSACSLRKDSKEELNLLANRIEPQWFAKSTDLQLATLAGEPQPHLFFDAHAGLSKNLNHVHFVPLSLAGERVQYTLHVPSGQRVFSHFNCSQPDAWGKRGTVTADTEFSTGFVPRFFDQLNEPQRIIVFGGADRFRLDQPLYYRVRLIGGYVEQSCPVGGCSGVKEWLGRLVLIGVDEEDARWSGVTQLPQLLKRVSWETVRAQLETLPGHNVVADKRWPALKAGDPISSAKALDFILKRSTTLTVKELVKTHKVCGKLYQDFWHDVGREIIIDAPVKTLDEARTHLQKVVEMAKGQQKESLPSDQLLQSMDTVNRGARSDREDILRNELITRMVSKVPYFNVRLRDFLATHATSLATCQRLVYPGNPNQNPERANFLLWSLMFVKLHSQGWTFSCRDRSWQLQNSGKKALTDMAENLQLCRLEDIDTAMRSMPEFLRSLRGLAGERWRFVGWDQHAHGSHAKVYSWVAVPERRHGCADDANGRVRDSWTEQPEEVPWKLRNVPNLLRDGKYIF